MPWVVEEEAEVSSAGRATPFEIPGAGGRWVEDDTPPPRSMAKEFVRQVGLTARHGVEGGMMLPALVGDAANSLIDSGIRYVNDAAGTNIPELGSVTNATKRVLDRAGLPTPETALERVVGEASRAVASIPSFTGMAAASGRRTLAPLTREIGLQARSAAGAGGAYGATKEAAPDSPILQFGAGLVGGAAGGVRAGEIAPQAAQRIEDFTRSRITPAIQDVTQSSVWQRFSKILEAVPFTSDTIRQRELTRLQQAEQSAARIADRLGTPGTPTRLGEQVQQGVEDYRFGRNVDDLTPREILTQPTRNSSIAVKANALYNRVPIDQTAMMAAPRTAETLRGAAQKYNNPGLSEVFATPLVRRIQQAVDEGGEQLMWGDLRQLRTDIRYQRTRAAIDPTIDDRILSVVDDAITQDMIAGARAAGGDRAVKQIEQADRYYRTAMQGATERLKSIFNANRPEQVWAQLEGAISAKPNRADIRKLAELRRALPREVWDDIASTIVDGFGRPTPGRQLPADMPQFSVAEFVTRYNSVSDDAKRLLFDGAGRENLRSELDALSRALANMKNTDRLSNVSQSGNMVIGAGTALSLLTNPLKTAAVLGGANVSARAMYNPTFVRLWTQGLKASNPATRQQHAVQVIRFAEQNPDLATDAANLLEGLLPVRAESSPQTNRDRR